jgi:hypothetical protein
VRRSGETVEVNAQLISTETGAHVWADRFEGDSSNLGKLQFEIVARLAHSLDVELTRAESLRAMRERPNNPDAVDLTLRGWAILYSNPTVANMAEAEALFERARALDPHNVPAIVGLARALIWLVNMSGNIDERSGIARAEEASDAALALEPDNSSAHHQKGWVFFDKGYWGVRSPKARRRSRTTTTTRRPTRAPVFGRCLSAAPRTVSPTLKLRFA